MKFRASSNTPSTGSVPWSSCKYRQALFVCCVPGLGEQQALSEG